MTRRRSPYTTPHPPELSRDNRRAILARLDEMLIAASRPDYEGTIEVSINVTGGRINKPKFTTTRYGL